MGRHSQWRKVVKKERRRKIRTQAAKAREDYSSLFENTYDFEKWLKEQEVIESLEYQQIENANLIENEKWLESEKTAMEQWQKLLEKKQMLHQKHLEQEAKKRMEWELEQKKKIEEKKRLKELEEENKRKQQVFLDKLEDFLSGDAIEPPAELLVARETKPDMEYCPFFSKTACCRFGDQCSRNHRYPGISKVLLATNFYYHFGLDNANYNEYDTDLMLEYEDSDTYKEFEEFFYDVLTEFEKFGRVVQFKVCNNHERHLRGNTYVEFCELRAAVSAYRALHSRWYAGRQLSLQFAHIADWKNAVCGLQARKRCPKGRACNFLHVFRNPKNLFGSYRSGQNWTSERTQNTPSQTWRWSESPETEFPRRRSMSPKRKRSRSPYCHQERRRLRSPFRKVLPSHKIRTGASKRNNSRSPSRKHSKSSRTNSSRTFSRKHSKKEHSKPPDSEHLKDRHRKRSKKGKRKHSKSPESKPLKSPERKHSNSPSKTPENGYSPEIYQSKLLIQTKHNEDNVI